MVARALARFWSLCVWNIADSQQQVAPKFRDCIIKEYLVFILKLGWQANEVCFDLADDGADGLEVWRDLFLKELQGRFAGDRPERINALKSAMKSLDQGKRYVFEGYSWLEKELFSKSGQSS